MADRIDVRYPSQADWALGEAWWEAGVGWHEIPLPALSFGERMERATSCQAGYPECSYGDNAHQHDLARIAHGHVLTLYVSDLANAIGAAGRFLVTTRGQTRGGGSYVAGRPHEWMENGEGHCDACRPVNVGECDRRAHR